MASEEKAWAKVYYTEQLQGSCVSDNVLFPSSGLMTESVEQRHDLRREDDQLLAIITHELRQPLTPILAAVELLRRHVSAEADSRAQSVIERQVKQLARLFEDLLDLERATQGRMRLRKQRVEIGRVIADAVESVRSAAETHGLRLVAEPTPNEVVLLADPDRLQQVLSNLLINAIKHTPREGTIFIKVAVRQEGVEIAVRDTGAGIPPQMLDEVFTLFTQFSDGDVRGLGIGLAVVRSLVELHGGTVMARSAGPDKGSEFVVILPHEVEAA
jgi:signal transduction histidine kinase